MPPKRKRMETVTQSETETKVSKKVTSTSRTSPQVSTSGRPDAASTRQMLHQPTSKTPFTRASLKTSSLNVTARRASLKSSATRITRGFLRSSTLSKTGKENFSKQPPRWMILYEEALLASHVSDDEVNDACYKGKLEVVKELLVSGSDVNKRSKDGWTPVMIAAYIGHKQLFDLLIEQGCNLLERLENDNNILHLACLGGNIDIVDFVITNTMTDIESKGMHGRTAVMKAAMVGEKKIFDLLLSKGCDLSGSDDYGNSILHLSCFSDNVEIVEFVMTRHIAGIDSLGEWERTPVMYAALGGNQKVFHFLVREGCDLSGVDKDKNTLLHLAMFSGSKEFVEYVFTHNIASLNSKGYCGRTPVMIAALEGFKEVFDFLVNKRSDLSHVDEEGDTVLHLTCYFTDDVEIVQYIIESGVVGIDTQGADGRTPVMFAAEMGQNNVFNLLVRKACDLSRVDEYGNSILHLACFSDSVDVVEYLISHNIVDINSRGGKGKTPVMFAAKEGQKKVFDLLVRKGCDLSLLDEYGNSILHLACLSGSVDIVEYLISHNIVDINSRGDKGKTPVMFAAKKGQKKVFDLLVRKGCDLSLVDEYGNSILHLACLSDSVDIVEYPISHNMVDINSRGNTGKTPVMFAAKKGQKKVFDLLVRKGCDLSLVDEYGNSILHLACLSDSVDIVEYLISHNIVDINSMGDKGKTPVMFAAEKDQKKVFDLLKSHGCDLSGVADFEH